MLSRTQSPSIAMPSTNDCETIATRFKTRRSHRRETGAPFPFHRDLRHPRAIDRRLFADDFELIVLEGGRKFAQFHNTPLSARARHMNFRCFARQSVVSGWFSVPGCVYSKAEQNLPGCIVLIDNHRSRRSLQFPEGDRQAGDCISLLNYDCMAMNI